VARSHKEAIGKICLPTFFRVSGGHVSVAVTSEEVSPTLGLLLAIFCGDIIACGAPMCKLASLSIRGAGYTPLLAAVARGHAGIIQLQRADMVDPNEADGRRLVLPLQQAVYFRLLSIAQDLIDGGALDNGVTGQRLPAPRVAGFLQKAEAVHLLMDAGAATGAFSCLRCTALHGAVFSKDLESTRALIRGSENVDVVDRKCWTLLVIAAAIDQVEIAKALRAWHQEGYIRTCAMQACSLAARTRKVRVIAVL